MFFQVLEHYSQITIFFQEYKLLITSNYCSSLHTFLYNIYCNEKNHLIGIIGTNEY